MNPLIGIVATELIDYPWAPRHFGQREGYVQAVEQAGGIPVIVPLVGSTATLRRIYNRLDGLLLAGGGDVDPRRYGQKPIGGLDRLSPDRDNVEFQLLEWALADDKSVLAICRGLQVLNVARGGTLTQDIAITTIDHNASRTAGDYTMIVHDIDIHPQTRLSAITGRRSMHVNSLHHQAIQDLGAGLVVSAAAPDGIIEAIEVPDKFVVGVQFHPETLLRDKACRSLFSAFVTASSPELSTDSALLPELA